MSISQELRRFIDFLCHSLFGIGPLFGPALVQPFRSSLQGAIGCGLQWITIGLLVFEWTGGIELTLSTRMWVFSLEIAAFLGGLFLAIRGGSLGPLIVVPGLFGIAILACITLLLYPLRFFFPDVGGPTRFPW